MDPLRKKKNSKGAVLAKKALLRGIVERDQEEGKQKSNHSRSQNGEVEFFPRMGRPRPGNPIPRGTKKRKPQKWPYAGRGGKRTPSNRQFRQSGQEDEICDRVD